MTTTAPTAVIAPAPVSPTLPPSAPVPSAPASRQSVLLLAAVVGLLAIAGLLYVLVDRPDLREPLEATATIVSAVSAAGALIWGVSRAWR